MLGVIPTVSWRSRHHKKDFLKRSKGKEAPLQAGSAIWAALLLHPKVKRPVGGCCWGTLLPIVPHASHFLFVFGNSWNLWVHWMTSQVFSSAYLPNGDSVLGFQFRLHSLKLYVSLKCGFLSEWEGLIGLQPWQSYNKCACEHRLLNHTAAGDSLS